MKIRIEKIIIKTILVIIALFCMGFAIINMIFCNKFLSQSFPLIIIQIPILLIGYAEAIFIMGVLVYIIFNMIIDIIGYVYEFVMNLIGSIISFLIILVSWAFSKEDVRFFEYLK